jgi:DNA-binding transcriptional LysR family regulator
MMQQLDLRDVADFLALVETGSFSKAAALRHVTQPAFSRRVKALEQALGLELIDRSRSPLVPTVAGRQLIPHARKLITSAQAALSDMQAVATSLPGALHIESSRSLASAFFPHWYRQMQRKVKGLSFRLTHQRSRTSLDHLQAGLADFAIQMMVQGVTRSEDYSAYKTKAIGTDRLLFVCAPLAHKDTVSIVRHPPGSYMTPCLEKSLGPARLAKMRTVFESPSSEFTRSMVLAGFGSALLPESLIADDLRDGYLIASAVPAKVLKTETTLVRAAHPLSPLAEQLWAKT